MQAMRLSHFALALTVILLAITGYLAWEAQEEARGARRELELVRRQQAARDVAMPQSPSVVAELPPPPEVPDPSAQAVPPLAGSTLMPGTPVVPSPAPAPGAADRPAKAASRHAGDGEGDRRFTKTRDLP